MELIGFAHRVFGPRVPHEAHHANHSIHANPAGHANHVSHGGTQHAHNGHEPHEAGDEHDGPQQGTAVRTEITFDFHRLGVLLLRAALRDGALVAKKIATATVSEARIQATVGQSHSFHQPLMPVRHRSVRRHLGNYNPDVRFT